MKEWTFAKTGETCADLLSAPFSPEDLYRESLRSREGKKMILSKALNAALENLMSWERVAKAWGFDVEVCTETGLGRPHPVFDGNTVNFVQSYGVIVREQCEEDAK